MELAPNIRVNSVCPGAVETAMTAGYIRTPAGDPNPAITARYAMGRHAQPEELAAAILFLTSDVLIHDRDRLARRWRAHLSLSVFLQAAPRTASGDAIDGRLGASRAVPVDKAECRLWFRKETIAGARHNGRDAPMD